MMSARPVIRRLRADDSLGRIRASPGLRGEGIDYACRAREAGRDTTFVFEEGRQIHELMVEDIDGIATVVQDQFRNTYELRSRG